MRSTPNLPHRTGARRHLYGKATKNVIEKVYKGFIQPRLEYGCALWSGGNNQTTTSPRQFLPVLPNMMLLAPATLVKAFYNPHFSSFLQDPNENRAWIPVFPPIRHTVQIKSVYSNLRRRVYPVPCLNKGSSRADFVPKAIVAWNNFPRYPTRKLHLWPI